MFKRSILAVVATAALVVPSAALADHHGRSNDRNREFTGTVAAVDATAQTFQLRTDSGVLVTFSVRARTEFESPLVNFASLTVGLQNVEVKARRAHNNGTGRSAVVTNGTLVAREVELADNPVADNNDDNNVVVPTPAVTPPTTVDNSGPGNAEDRGQADDHNNRGRGNADDEDSGSSRDR